MGSTNPEPGPEASMNVAEPPRRLVLAGRLACDHQDDEREPGSLRLACSRAFGGRHSPPRAICSPEFFWSSAQCDIMNSQFFCQIPLLR
jgi:hypothetical protein